MYCTIIWHLQTILKTIISTVPKLSSDDHLNCMPLSRWSFEDENIGHLKRTVQSSEHCKPYLLRSSQTSLKRSSQTYIHTHTHTPTHIYIHIYIYIYIYMAVFRLCPYPWQVTWKRPVGEGVGLAKKWHAMAYDVTWLAMVWHEMAGIPLRARNGHAWQLPFSI